MILKGGSPAIHKLGDIWRPVDDLIRVHSENENQYIGNFEEGFGFIDVKFDKNDCRPLTQEEREELNGTWYTISGNPLYKIYVDTEGNIINGKIITAKGVISKVTNASGEDKPSNFVGFQVEFGEDILMGRSLVMLTGEGTITTSKVTQLLVYDNQYVVYTKNSVYYIDIK